MTWKLFETLLCKRHSHVAHNLVLRNLASHAHISLTSSVQNSVTPRDVLTAETNCIYNRTVTTHTNEVASSNCVSSSSSISAPQKLSAENCDARDSGLCGISTNNIHSSSSSPVSDSVLDSLKVNTVASLCEEDSSTLSEAETDKADVTDTLAGSDAGACCHVLSKSRSAFETQTGSFPLPSTVTASQTLVESSGSPIQQVVYT